MKDFVKVITVQEDSIESYLKDGWEIIDTTKVGYGDRGFYLNYHLGLSTRSMMTKYKEIIDSYEKFGFKEQLFKQVAISNGQKYEDYTNSTIGRRSKDETIEFMENYERNVHDKIISYYRMNNMDAEIHF